ncbi:hypothetical protein BT69DRAFT_197247 [Atractiella rhizophila]|nr:hypothetical protein BT69DRAFT_197247 [Atractiella rhizophila]
MLPCVQRHGQTIKRYWCGLRGAVQLSSSRNRVLPEGVRSPFYEMVDWNVVAGCETQDRTTRLVRFHLHSFGTFFLYCSLTHNDVCSAPASCIVRRESDFTDGYFRLSRRPLSSTMSSRPL